MHIKQLYTPTFSFSEKKVAPIYYIITFSRKRFMTHYLFLRFINIIAKLSESKLYVVKLICYTFLGTVYHIAILGRRKTPDIECRSYYTIDHLDVNLFIPGIN